MDRREMLGIVGAGAVGLVAAAPARAQGAGQGQGHDEHLAVMARCARHCAEAAHHCLHELKKGGSDAEKHAKALATAAACEDFCILSAKQMACHSPLAHLAHQANAEACEQCARACEGIEGDVMKACVESCHKCAEVCRSMSQKNQARAGSQ